MKRSENQPDAIDSTASRICSIRGHGLGRNKVKDAEPTTDRREANVHFVTSTRTRTGARPGVLPRARSVKSVSTSSS